MCFNAAAFSSFAIFHVTGSEGIEKQKPVSGDDIFPLREQQQQQHREPQLWTKQLALLPTLRILGKFFIEKRVILTPILRVYKRVSPLVGWRSVGRSVGRSIARAVGPSVTHFVVDNNIGRRAW